MRKYSFIIAAILCIPLYAQNTKGDHNGSTSTVEPIESARLQGPREATEAEKEYARRLAEDRAQQAQIDNNSLQRMDKPLHPMISIIRLGVMVLEHGDCIRD